MTTGADVQAALNRLIRRRQRRQPKIITRPPVLGTTGTGEAGEAEDTTPPPLAGDWIYYPCSDDAPWSWGDPYATELGTPLSGSPCASSNLRFIESDKHPYRLYTESDDTVSHGTNQMMGRHYWKHDDYVITWGAVFGHESRSEQFTDNETRSIYYNGAPLIETFRSGSDNPMEIVGAGIRHDSGTNYLFMSSNGQGTGAYLGRYLLQRTPLDPYNYNATADWYFSLNLESILAALTPPFNTSNPIISTAFNKSCTRMIINQPGRVVEIDISGAWGSETVVKDDYFGDTIDLGNFPSQAPYNYGPASGEIPVLSGFQPDSDTRRDLTIRIDHTGYSIGTPHDICDQPQTTITATLMEDGQPINSWDLWRDTGSGPSGEDFQENAFITVNPFFQDVQARVYSVEYLRARRHEDDWSTDNPGEPWLKRYHRQEIYRQGELFYSRDLIENHPNPTGGLFTYEPREFMWTGARSTRDLQTYPQCGLSRTEFKWAVIVSEDIINGILGECIGYHQAPPSSGVHSVDGFHTSADKTYEPTFGSVRYNSLNHVAFAANWEGAFVLSQRVFDDWNALRDPKWEWINVGTVDLPGKTGATGANQRLMTRGCNTLNDYLKPNLQQIGVYHNSADAPFPP